MERRSFLRLAAAAVPASVAPLSLQAAQELPVDKAERLMNELSAALDEWSAQTNISFDAIVSPASSGRGSHFRKAVKTPETPEERYQYHLTELKKAAEELDPRIGEWKAIRAEDRDHGCALLIVADRVRTTYEGDGLYEVADECITGRSIVYRVTLLERRQDGHRMFDCRTLNMGDRLILAEPRFRTYFGRKLPSSMKEVL